MPIDTTRLEKKLRAIDSFVLKEDHEKFMEFIVKFMASLKKANAETIQGVKDIFNNYLSRAKDETATSLSDAKEKMLDYLTKELRTLMAEHKSRLTEIDNKIASVRDGKDADEEQVAIKASNLAITAISPKLLTIDQVEENLRNQGDLIASLLEALPEPEKLEIRAIKKLREELDELRRIRSRGLGGSSFSFLAMQQHILPWTETSVAPNGVLTDFVIGYTPNPTNSLEVMVDNSPLFETSDWTYTAATKTISFLVAPPNGAKIRYKCLI